MMDDEAVAAPVTPNEMRQYLDWTTTSENGARPAGVKEQGEGWLAPADLTDTPRTRNEAGVKRDGDTSSGNTASSDHSIYRSSSNSSDGRDGGSTGEDIAAGGAAGGAAVLHGGSAEKNIAQESGNRSIGRSNRSEKVQLISGEVSLTPQTPLTTISAGHPELVTPLTTGSFGIGDGSTNKFLSTPATATTAATVTTTTTSKKKSKKSTGRKKKSKEQTNDGPNGQGEPETPVTTASGRKKK